MTQSYGEGLCRRVSQPSYQAPVGTKTPGRRIGGEGFVRLEAGAKNSSEKARIEEDREEEMRSEPVRLERRTRTVERGHRCRWI